MRSPVRPGGLLVALVCGLVVLGVRAAPTGAAEAPEEFERRRPGDADARRRSQ